METIEEVVLYYDPKELEKWKNRDPKLVPKYFLNHAGPGVSQGYHYGECFVNNHLIKKGNDVISPPECFNIFAKNTKFKENNKLIEKAMGSIKYCKLRDTLREMVKRGIKIENPDICVLRPKLFFADVKKDKDKMRQPQDNFANACSKLGIPFIVYKLIPSKKNR